MSIQNLINRCWRLYASGEFQSLVLEAAEIDRSGAQAAEKEELLYLEALGLWRLEQTKIAVEKVHDLLELNPASASAHLQLANMLDDLEQFEEAEKHYAQADELVPSSSAILADWAIMLYRANQVELALERFQEAERYGADDKYFHLYRGLCLEAIGEVEAAAKDLELCLERGGASHDGKPGRDPFVLARLGVIYIEVGHFDQAEDLLREAQEAEPTEPAHLYHLALCMKRKGELDEAEDLMFRLIEIDPESDESWGLLGDLELERGNDEAAIDRYRKSLQINPHGSHTLSGLAWIHFRKEKLELARKLCLQALRCDSGNLSALDLLREMEPEKQRLCRYTVEIHGETKDEVHFHKTMDCLAETPEQASDYVKEIQQIFREEAWWEIVEMNFVEPVSEDHPGVVWISDTSICS